MLHAYRTLPLTLLLCACMAPDVVDDPAGVDDGAIEWGAPETATPEPGQEADGAGEVLDPEVDEAAPSRDEALAVGVEETAASRCTVSPERVQCSHGSKALRVSLLVKRDVHYQVPLGTPPPGGWPVAIMFQGSLFSAELTFEGSVDQPFGGYFQALTAKELLDGGYAVIAPEAHLEGSTFWDTNVPPWNLLWPGAPDDRLMLSLFNAIAAGRFGPLDASRLYATGISSGGYMTSRMAVSYPGRFKALAIHSASYATCSGPLCYVPSSLPDDHPPTLFLHGRDDLIVPIWTMECYLDQLLDDGHVVDTVVNPDAGHEWIPEAPLAVRDWFDAWP